MGVTVKRFKTPAVGSTITVTTRYRNLLLDCPAEFDEHTYTDVEVLPPYDWMKNEEFRIKDVHRQGNGNIEWDRVISTKHVVDMTGEFEEADNSVRVVPVGSSRTDEVYSVTVDRGVATDCTCKGFMFRRRCSHLKKALEV